MSSAEHRDALRLGEVAPSPSTGSIAQTRLAGDAAAVLHWLRVLSREDGAAGVAAALDVVGALRTDLRSLRPILDKDWTVALRELVVRHRAAELEILIVHRVRHDDWSLPRTRC